ncbi:MAG: aminotransferase class III-fold pyridoxal phosphate-dependent enzyme [Bacillota bacterium]
MNNFTEYVNPHLGKLLEQVKMDKVFVRGEGNYLYDSGGKRYLDFIAAYGALPFGYNPPEIWQALEQVRSENEPSFIQPSALGAAGELARRLVELAPGNPAYVTFTNSGAEAVEAAIKMARSATGRPGIISTANSFHGKTLGALSATGREYYQAPFGAPVEGFKTIPFGDATALERELKANGNSYAAFIVEPIQGEGGIVEPPAGYLSRAEELCRQYGVLLILDEIQTGLGRTGRLFACEEDGLCPDIILLAKALGGGIYPIGACISTAGAYTREFGERHSSTFAGNTPGCRIGLRVLDILTRDRQAIVRQVRENGHRLKEALIELQRRFPRVLKGVRGRGYMLGLEFEMTRLDFPNSFLSVLSLQDNLTPLISSYLLNVEGLRVAPTLNGNRVIRIEPPLTTTWEQCRAAIESLIRVLEVLDSGNTAELLRPVLEIEERITVRPPGVELYTWDRYKPSPDPREGKFAFLIHPLDLDNLYQFDTSLKVLPTEKLQKVADLGASLIDPFVIGKTTVVSESGCRTYGEFISLPHTTREMLEMDSGEIITELEKALELAAQRGARLVGLGAYTSVVSRSGTLLQGRYLPLTTGNSYTVVCGAEAVKLAARIIPVDLSRTTAAVIGATGSIGRTLAILLSEEMNSIVLVGNSRHPQASSRRLRHVGADICLHLAKLLHQGWSPPGSSLGTILARMALPPLDAPPEEWLPAAESLEREGRLVITTDLSRALPEAGVVITATSSVDDLINPMWVSPGAIICDISRPSNVRPTLRQIRPDVLVIDGGVVAVPGRPSLGWDFGFEPGLVYACMAETMLLSLEQQYRDISLGSYLSLDDIVYLRGLAVKHGFNLAQLRSFGQPLGKKDLEHIARAGKRTVNHPMYGSIS